MLRHWLKLFSVLSLTSNFMNAPLPLSPFPHLAFLSTSVLISVTQRSLMIHAFLIIISKSIFILHYSKVFKTVICAFFLETLPFHNTSMFFNVFSNYSSVFTSSSLSQSPNISRFPFSSILSIGNLIHCYSFSHHLSACNYYIYIHSCSLSLKFLTCMSNFLLNISTLIGSQI